MREGIEGIEEREGRDSIYELMKEKIIYKLATLFPAFKYIFFILIGSVLMCLYSSLMG
jgi:hypothetical protein